MTYLQEPLNQMSHDPSVAMIHKATHSSKEASDEKAKPVPHTSDWMQEVGIQANLSERGSSQSRKEIGV